MKTIISKIESLSRRKRFLLVAVVIAAVAVALSPWWLPGLPQLNIAGARLGLAAENERTERSGHDDGAHDHNHSGHEEATSLELSAQARRNIGLTKDMVRPIALETYTRALDIPAMVVERPGRTKVQIAAPMSGVVTRVNVVQGEVAEPGTPLFTIQLTHEDLVTAQTVYLKTLGELDVIEREIERLREITSQGAIAEKVLLQKQYEMHKSEAVLDAYRESLQLHGLSNQQIDQISSSRKLIREVSIVAPSPSDHEHKSYGGPVAGTERHASYAQSDADNVETPDFFVVQEVIVQAGQFVAAGDSLAVLADFGELFIQGRAFEQDADELMTAARQGFEVTAVTETNGRVAEQVNGLKIVYVDNEVEPESRALYFYVILPNEAVHDARSQDGHRFVTWKFRLGQRMQLRVPVEQWSDRIVLPVDAVVQEGVEFFVFQENGGHFDRRAVHVEYRDQFSAVIANDGSLFPGDRLAFTGAHQMQMALKNKAGGGVDPHAGHNH